MTSIFVIDIVLYLLVTRPKKTVVQNTELAKRTTNKGAEIIWTNWKKIRMKIFNYLWSSYRALKCLGNGQA